MSGAAGTAAGGGGDLGWGDEGAMPRWTSFATCLPHPTRIAKATAEEMMPRMTRDALAAARLLLCDILGVFCPATRSQCRFGSRRCDPLGGATLSRDEPSTSPHPHVGGHLRPCPYTDVLQDTRWPAAALLSACATAGRRRVAWVAGVRAVSRHPIRACRHLVRIVVARRPDSTLRSSYRGYVGGACCERPVPALLSRGRAGVAR